MNVYIDGLDIPKIGAGCMVYKAEIYSSDDGVVLFVRNGDKWSRYELEEVSPFRGRLISDRELQWAFDDAILEEAELTGKVRATHEEVAKVIRSVRAIIPDKEDNL